jgi:prephenate dehydrogenase
MKIVVFGAGNMGSWFVESLCLDHDVAVFDVDKTRLRYFFQARKFISLDEVAAFQPEMVINAASLQLTIKIFDQLIPYLPANCIISDITSVKTGLQEYYKKVGMRFVSTHPMFGPTFANVRSSELSSENAIIIEEGDEEGKKFFFDFYNSLKLNIYEYSFRVHDQMIAYSLSIPFASTLVFASCMKKLDAPGTTFKKHMAIAKGLMSENDYLLSEILFSPYTLEQLDKITIQLEHLKEMIKNRDTGGLHEYIAKLRKNIE